MTDTQLPEVNRDMFRRIEEQCRAHPETHDQAMFEHIGGSTPYHAACNTTRCVGGWALHFTNPTQRIQDTAMDLLGRDDVEAAATRVLGLTEREATALFFEFNEEEALEMVHNYAEHGRSWDQWED